jgi:hypothetical protein
MKHAQAFARLAPFLRTAQFARGARIVRIARITRIARFARIARLAQLACVAAMLIALGLARARAQQDLARASAQVSEPSSVRARLELDPPHASIGEPVTCALIVEHPRDVSVKLPEKDPFAGDASWVELGEHRVVKEIAPGGGWITRAVWRVMALEPGARALPAIDVEYESAGAVHTANAASVALDVRGELGDGDAEPRPMKGFRPPPPGSDGPRRWPWIVAAAAIAAVFAVMVARRLRRKPAPVATVSPLDRLSELERAIAADPDAGRAVTYGASALLRSSVDEFLRESNAGLTDRDWIARIENDERVPLGVRSACARLLREAEEVKYALHVPTRFAVEEMLRGARDALDALSRATPPERTADTAAQATGDKEAA